MSSCAQNITIRQKNRYCLEGENCISVVSPVKTGVQSVRKAPKILDFGFHRNDVEENQIYFFTPSQELRRKYSLEPLSLK